MGTIAVPLSVRVSVLALKLPVMPFWLMKFSVSALAPPAIDTVAPVTVEVDALTISPESSATGLPPTTNVTVAPAVTVGGLMLVKLKLAAVAGLSVTLTE